MRQRAPAESLAHHSDDEATSRAAKSPGTNQTADGENQPKQEISADAVARSPQFETPSCRDEKVR